MVGDGVQRHINLTEEGRDNINHGHELSVPGGEAHS
jgi:hypothetical protein